jgi:predicted nucleic acid-binding Zn ribbon protein
MIANIKNEEVTHNMSKNKRRETNMNMFFYAAGAALGYLVNYLQY